MAAGVSHGGGTLYLLLHETPRVHCVTSILILKFNKNNADHILSQTRKLWGQMKGNN